MSRQEIGAIDDQGKENQPQRSSRDPATAWISHIAKVHQGFMRKQETETIRENRGTMVRLTK